MRMARSAVRGAPRGHWCVGGRLECQCPGGEGSCQAPGWREGPEGPCPRGGPHWTWGSAGGLWVASSLGTPLLEAVSSRPAGGGPVGPGACAPLPRGRGLKQQQEGRLRRPVCVGGASWLLAVASELATWGPGLGGRLCTLRCGHAHWLCWGPSAAGLRGRRASTFGVWGGPSLSWASVWPGRCPRSPELPPAPALGPRGSQRPSLGLAGLGEGFLLCPSQPPAARVILGTQASAVLHTEEAQSRPGGRRLPGGGGRAR